jgi:hypothetical protein
MSSYNIKVGHTISGYATSTPFTTTTTMSPMTTNIHVGDTHSNATSDDNEQNQQSAPSLSVGAMPTHVQRTGCPVPNSDTTSVTSIDSVVPVHSIVSASVIRQKDVVSGFYAITKPGH